ncbi:substrate-binding domain-containing protein [Clostridium sp.]|uniref:substrate-binding domain-containing protein n=1 Tax=Clostridium sp. TaxID=1506 RepID=UPI002608CCAD|nr:substrate-binding domain-containing protein [Clostridium sp.]
MKLKKKSIIFVLFCLLITSFISILFLSSSKETKIYNIAVIVRGRNSESWTIIKEGMEQAASEMNVNISFITLLEENNIKEQKELIEREIENKVDSIVISPADYLELTKIIEITNKKIPVILFESNIETQTKIPYISCDNEELGKKLAEEVVRNGNLRNNITILRSRGNFSSTNERIKGFIKELKLSKNSYEFLDLPKDEVEISLKINEIIEKNSTDVVISFEPNVLEILGKAKKNFNSVNKIKSKIEVYGSGSSSAIVSLIEENIINGIAMQNEVNLGYLSIKAAVEKIEKKEIDKGKINSTIINSENMYSKENQRILFPIVR